MPGSVARTSTFALNNVTLPFVKALADKGLAALNKSRSTPGGGVERPSRCKVTYEAMAHDLNLPLRTGGDAAGGVNRVNGRRRKRRRIVTTVLINGVAM